MVIQGILLNELFADCAHKDTARSVILVAIVLFTVEGEAATPATTDESLECSRGEGEELEEEEVGHVDVLEKYGSTEGHGERRDWSRFLKGGRGSHRGRCGRGRRGGGLI